MDPKWTQCFCRWTQFFCRWTQLFSNWWHKKIGPWTQIVPKPVDPIFLSMDPNRSQTGGPNLFSWTQNGFFDAFYMIFFDKNFRSKFWVLVVFFLVQRVFFFGPNLGPFRWFFRSTHFFGIGPTHVSCWRADPVVHPICAQAAPRSVFYYCYYYKYTYNWLRSPGTGTGILGLLALPGLPGLLDLLIA